MTYVSAVFPKHKNCSVQRNKNVFYREKRICHNALWEDLGRARTLCSDGLYRFWLQISSAYVENVTQLFNYEGVVAELSYIVFYWPIHAIIGNSMWLVACKTRPFTNNMARKVDHVLASLPFIIHDSWFNTSVVLLYLDKPLNGIFSSNVFSVWDTGRCNTTFEGAVMRQWPY